MQVFERSQEAMLDGAPEGSGTGGLAHLLLNSYQERLIQNRLQQEQEREDGAREEEEEEEDDSERGHVSNYTVGQDILLHSQGLLLSAADNQVQEEGEPTSEEKALLREEFISQMHQSFLDGKDKDFNYRLFDCLCNNSLLLCSSKNRSFKSSCCIF